MVSSGLVGAPDPATKAAKTNVASPVAVKTFPHDQIVAEGAKLSKAPLVTGAAARNAAQMLLSKNYGTFSNLDVDQLVVRLLEQAEVDANADLRAQMAAMKKTAAAKKALRASTTKPAVVTTDQPKSAVDTADLLPSAPGATGNKDTADARAKQELADKAQIAADEARLLELQDRKDKFAQLLSDLQHRLPPPKGS